MPRSERCWVALLAAALVLDASPAGALTLSLVEEETPFEGVVFRHYRTSSPSTHTWVALIDLCGEGVHVDGTRAPSSLRTTGSWASSRGVQVATNGDFFRTDPVRVYGNAVGDGVAWPSAQTGDDPDYSSEWYYHDYGWIAFLWDGVEFTHTRWVKDHADTLGATGGWQPDEVAPALPPGVLALVSGFPELVVEGTQITCSSPTADSCFPDRSDMRDRNPRTAMGLTEDLQTFILAVVDGRSASSAGMYGSELADLMFQLGAWEAFNLDGGGSSTLWVDGSVRNVPSDGSQRAVANHWGVFAGLEGGRALRPGHCASSAPCATIPAEGGIVDDEGPCFARYGSEEYWREQASGYDGHLFWTNAWETRQPDNWAWWRLELAEAGEYLVEYYAEAGFAVFDRTHYVVQASGATTTLAIDQSAGTGWQPLGSFVFAAGGDQFVAVYDDLNAAVPDDQHVAADALRLTRVGAWCGDGACDADESCGSCADDCAGPAEIPDNGVDDDCDGAVDEAGGGDGDADADAAIAFDADLRPDAALDAAADGAADADADADMLQGGCSCTAGSAAPSAGAAWLALALAWLARRRR